MVFSTDDCFN